MTVKGEAGESEVNGPCFMHAWHICHWGEHDYTIYSWNYYGHWLFLFLYWDQAVPGVALFLDFHSLAIRSTQAKWGLNALRTCYLKEWKKPQDSAGFWQGPSPSLPPGPAASLPLLCLEITKTPLYAFIPMSFSCFVPPGFLRVFPNSDPNLMTSMECQASTTTQLTSAPSPTWLPP